MSNLTLSLDKRAANNIEKLKKHYGVSSKAAVITKALALLLVASEIENNKGELIVKDENSKETRILLR